MTTTTTSTANLNVVADLKTILGKYPDLEIALNKSLKIAVEEAGKRLDPNLYNAINKVFKGKGWPTNVNEYYSYLALYLHLVPNEENDADYPNAWKSDGTKNGYNQKVYDLLCQFYWLVDQHEEGDEKTMQSNPVFATWLVEFAVGWGMFLDDSASLTPESLASFKEDSMYNFPLYSDGEERWQSFNQFFFRDFNGADAATGISPLRPIASPQDNCTIVAAADCTYKADYAIDGDGNVLDTADKKIKIALKQTHSIGSIDELLDGSPYAKDFYGGTFVHYFLSPFDYHRFHTAVAGEILEIKAARGKVYLSVELPSDGQFHAPDGSEDGYEFSQARGIVIIDAGPKVGKIAMLPIGMAQVSGVDMYTNLQGETVVKGQEFGKFQFGGSDMIMLFQKAPDLYLFKNDPGHNPIHFQYGQTAAYWR